MLATNLNSEGVFLLSPLIMLAALWWVVALELNLAIYDTWEISFYDS